MHSDKAYVMPHHTVSLKKKTLLIRHNYIGWLALHFESSIYNARYSAIWRQIVKSAHAACSDTMPKSRQDLFQYFRAILQPLTGVLQQNNYKKNPNINLIKLKG